MNAPAARSPYRRFLPLFTALMAVLLLSACPKDESTPTTTTPPSTRYIGLWRLMLVGDPADPGFDMRINAAGTFQLYVARTTTLKAEGVYTVDDERNLTGTWQSTTTSLHGRMTFALTTDDSADFYFIEDKPEGVKTVLYRGNRVP